MKKIIIFSFGLVFACVLSLPLVIAGAIKKGVAQLNEQTNLLPGVEIQLGKLNQSYFRSDLELNIQLNNLNLASKPLLLHSSIHIQHGPLIWSPEAAFALASLQLQLTPDIASGWREHFTLSQAVPLYQLEGEINLLGDSVFTDKLAALSWQDSSQSIAISNAVGNGELHPWQRKLNYVSALTQFEFDNNRLHVSIANPHVSKSIRLQPASWMFDNKVTFDALTVTKSVNLMLKSGVLRVANQPGVENSQQNLIVESHIGEYKNPLMSVQKFDAQVQLNGVPNQFIVHLVELIQNSSEADQFTPSLLAVIQKELLPAQPHLVIKPLRGGETPNHFDLSADLALTDSNTLQLAPLLESPAPLLPHLNVQSDLTLGKNWVNILGQLLAPSTDETPQGQQLRKMQTNMMTQLFLNQGMMTEENGSYKTHATLNKGVLRLNDKPFALPF